MWFCFPGLTVGIVIGAVIGGVGYALIKGCCKKSDVGDAKDKE
jgi:hypothetical protein